MSKMLDYGRTFNLWRDSAPKFWDGYVNHRFVIGLSDGTLPRKEFLNYLRQDYLFLEKFARAWALAVVKALDLEEMKAAVTIVNALIHDEMQLHVKFCRSNGIDELELSRTEEAPANLAYTRYVLETGYTGSFLDLMAALAPCVFGYGEIGRQLAQKSTNDTYIDWISTYSSSEYQELCGTVGSLIDRAVSLRLGEQAHKTPIWIELCEKFKIATKLEINFWEMGKNL
tara:strand:+ start:384 stop:1067 length:684 start_codon:yes stop_codon:yes gene_type:complete